MEPLLLCQLNLPAAPLQSYSGFSTFLPSRYKLSCCSKDYIFTPTFPFTTCTTYQKIWKCLWTSRSQPRKWNWKEGLASATKNDPKQALKWTINYSHNNTSWSIWNDLHSPLTWISRKEKQIAKDLNHNVFVSLPKISCSWKMIHQKLRRTGGSPVRTRCWNLSWPLCIHQSMCVCKSTWV